MKSFTIMMEPEDIERFKRFAKEINLPPHVLARSILLRGLKAEIKRWIVEEKPLESQISTKKQGENDEMDHSREVI